MPRRTRAGASVSATRSSSRKSRSPLSSSSARDFSFARLRNLHGINPGFDSQNILLFGIDPHLAGYTDQQTQQLYANLQQRFAALPGVISASYSEEALLSGGWSAGDVHVDGAPPKQNANTGKLPVGLNFFSTMRIPMLAGRSFTSADFAAAAATNAAEKARDAAAAKTNPASPPAPAALSALDEAYYHSAPVPLIINEAFARKYLANQNPIGLHMGDAWHDDAQAHNPGPGYTIVGVVGDTKYAYLRRNIAPIIFFPLVSNEAHFELRTAANPTALVKNVRDIVSRAGDNLPLTDVRTQTEQIDQILFRERLMSRLSSFFGGLALVLACIGLYGLLSYEVARRTHELGIRMTLGAQRRDLLRLVVGQGILLVLIGAAIGIAAAIGVTRFMSAMLYGIHARRSVDVRRRRRSADARRARCLLHSRAPSDASRSDGRTEIRVVHRATDRYSPVCDFSIVLVLEIHLSMW